MISLRQVFTSTYNMVNYFHLVATKSTQGEGAVVSILCLTQLTACSCAALSLSLDPTVSSTAMHICFITVSYFWDLEHDYYFYYRYPYRYLYRYLN